MTTLAQLLDEYVQIRRGLGYQLAREPHLITQFIDFLAQAGSDHITNPLAIRWAIASPGGSAQRAHDRLRMVRGFAKYVAAHDPRTEIPPYACLPVAPTTRTTPYIYTEDEITHLIGTARALSRLKGHTYATLLGLLASTHVADCSSYVTASSGEHASWCCIRPVSRRSTPTQNNGTGHNHIHVAQASCCPWPVRGCNTKTYTSRSYGCCNARISPSDSRDHASMIYGIPLPCPR